MSKITWRAEKKDVSSLKPHPKNPRSFTKKGLEDLDKSIEAIGMAQPININPDGTILSGHARVLKLKEKGIKEVEVYIPNRDLNEKEQEQVLVRMNANTAGEWDIDKLANEFELPDLSEWGLEIPDIELSLPQIETEGDDDIPEAVPTITVKGDLYELGDHRLLCGDSTIIDNVEKVMNGEKVDSLQCDPPYGVDYSSKNEFLNKFNKGNSVDKAINNDSIENYREFFNGFLSIIPFAEYNTIYCWMSNLELHNLRLSFDDCNIKWGDYLVWVKNNHVLGRKDYNAKHEFCVYGWKGKHKFYGDFSTTILEFNKPLKNELHPTMKPIELISKLIKDGCKEQGLVYDAFLGSGSTLIACEKTNRKCYGIELDEHYCDVIVKRYINFCENNGKNPIVKRNGEDCLKEFK